MGLERIIGFINKNLSYHGIKEISKINCSNKMIAENIFFDFNFIIYINLVELENELNDLLKIVCSLPYTDIKTIEKNMENKLDKPYFSIFKDDIMILLDGSNQEEIVDNLNKFIFSEEYYKKYIKKILGDFNDDSLFSNNVLLYLIFYLKIFYNIEENIDQIHYKEFVKNIFLFFDGIPSYSKILEQKRRRTKNFLESKIRKELYSDIFNKLKNDIYEEDNMIYNYFDWLNKKISLDKSFGPSSNLIINLEKFLKLFYKSNNLLKLDYDLNICSGRIYGESDFKIFKYIQKKKIKDKIFIHTCDSDFVHLVLVQQILGIINQNNTNYHIMRYYSKDQSSVQYIDSYYIVKELLKIVKKIFDTNDNKYNILLDFLGLCYLFGNDHLPNNEWFGSELSFEEILYLLKDSYNNEYLINTKNDKIEINWQVFLNFLINLKKKNTSTKIMIMRNYRKYDGFVNYLSRIDLEYDDFINKYIPEYLSYLGYLNKKENKNIDIEYRYDDYFYDKLKIEENPFSKLFKDKKKLEMFCNSLKAWINKYRVDDEDYIIKPKKSYELDVNNYQNLYNYISELANEIGSKKYSIYFSNNTINEDESDEKCENYLMIFYYLVKNFFIKMDNYNSCNLTFYKFINSPKLDYLINYLNKINLNEINDKFNKIINQNYLDNKDYFNNLSHHLFITPYLLNSDYKDKINNIDHINEILNSLDDITNLCIDESSYNYNFKLIEPKIFLNKMKEIYNEYN